MLIATCALFVFALAFQVTSIPIEERHLGTGNWQTPEESFFWGLLMLPAAIIGVVVARKQPDNRIGWVFCAGGSIGILAMAADQWGAYALIVSPGTVPGGTVAFLTSYSGLYASWCLLGVFVPLMFPDRRLDSRFRKIVASAGSIAACLWITEMFRPDAFSWGYYAKEELLKGVGNPIGIPGATGILEIVNLVGLFGLFGAMFLAIGSLVPRVFRSHGIERQQLKVVAYTVVVAAVGSFIGANLMNVQGVSGTVAARMIDGLLTVLIVAIPISFGVATLRYRLYDIDVVINKTLVYGSLAVFVTAVYIAVVAGVGAAIGSGDKPNLVLSLVATAVVAIAFHPLREVIQRYANRFVYGHRATPYELMTDLAPRMAMAVTLDDVLPRMAEFAARGVGAEAARIRLMLPNGKEHARVWPLDAGEHRLDSMIEVVHSGDKIGEIAVRKPGGDTLTPSDTRRLAEFAVHAGLALSSVRLTAELQDKLDEISIQAQELRESRQRIVEASDAGRRRIERDLHDGAQQRLVAVVLELRMLEGRLASDHPAHDELAKATGDLQEALAELRELARGIHPAILTEQGLAPALESLVQRSNVAAELVEAPDERLPALVEAAAYYVVAEALTNVSRYARATRVVVSARLEDGSLCLEVADDGVGGADVSKGSGLRGLGDRVAALSGTLEVDSPEERGTRIAVRLPCG